MPLVKAALVSAAVGVAVALALAVSMLAVCVRAELNQMSGSGSGSGSGSHCHSAADEQWTEFKLTYSKQYSSIEEEAARYQLFKNNMARAAWLNEVNPQATFGATRFADLDPQEFKDLYLTYRPDAAAAKDVQRQAVQIKRNAACASANTTVDWRAKGAVTAVNDQGKCGSCWAFSAVETIESAWFLKHGTLPTLSTQQVVSCDIIVDAGCAGGRPPSAFDYIKAHGLESDSVYPYHSGTTGFTGFCKYSPASVSANITGYSYATPPCNESACAHQDEALLLNNLASSGPVSICVNAAYWELYKSGIITSPLLCSGKLDDLSHCVQLVGYQADSSTPYWIVRNSYGSQWGEQGYINLAFGKNICGLANLATIPTVA